MIDDNYKLRIVNKLKVHLYREQLLDEREALEAIVRENSSLCRNDQRMFMYKGEIVRLEDVKVPRERDPTTGRRLPPTRANKLHALCRPLYKAWMRERDALHLEMNLTTSFLHVACTHAATVEDYKLLLPPVVHDFLKEVDDLPTGPGLLDIDKAEAIIREHGHQSKLLKLHFTKLMLAPQPVEV